MQYSKSIKILGAGISGMSTAIVLAKNGFKVDVFEKRPTVGSFFKKDVHSIRNYYGSNDELENYRKMGISMPKTQAIFKEIRFSPSLKRVEIYSKKKPIFYNFIRGSDHENSLDVKLFKEASENGVKFHFGQSLLGDDVDVIATGARIAKAIAYGEHYKLSDNAKPLDSVYVFFDNKYAPSGYIYISPFFNELSIVLVVMNYGSKTASDSTFNIEDSFNEFKKQNKIANNIIGEATLQNRISGYAFYDKLDYLPSDTKLYTGEAAGLLDATMGFGTHYAILSGYFSAQSIMTGKDYKQLFKTFFNEDMKTQLNKREKMDRLSNDDYDNIIDMLIKNLGDRIEIDKYKEFKESLY